VIKPFKVQPKIPENFEQDTWFKLKSAVSAVFLKSSSSISKEELYRAVEDLCVQKLASGTYTSLIEEIRYYICQKVEFLLNQTADLDNFLFQVDCVWRDYCEQLNTVRNIFLYLDRSYASACAGVKPIWDAGNNLFRQQVDNYPELHTKLITGLLKAIESIRHGHNSGSELVGRLIGMLLTLDLYNVLFEQRFLQDSTRFFTQEGNHYISFYTISQFFNLVDFRITEATELVSKYMSPMTKRSLLDIVEQNLLKPHASLLLEKGFQGLLEEQKMEDIRRVAVLCERVAISNNLKLHWSAYIKRVGEALISSSTSIDSNSLPSGATINNSGLEPKNFVEDVLAFQERLDIILKQCFNNQSLFKQALKSSFEYFLNINQKITAEQLARYVDKKMRGEKGFSELEIENRLDQVILIFKYLQEKDIFEAFYKKHLSKRLLLGKSASYELEKSMLAKLKAECGAPFTAKLDGMFTDVELSKQCQSEFQKYLGVNGNTSLGSSTEMQIEVLTTGYWPAFSPMPSLILPLELTSLMEEFQTFYNKHYQGRRLTWAHTLERCIVVGRFSKGKKDLEVSLFQAIILKCFNSSEKLSFSAIREKTGIEIQELKRTLQSLACGVIGTRVILKEPKGKDVEESDCFVFNSDFTNKLYRIKINTIQAKETQEEIVKTHDEINRDREYQVDAAVVRIMKSRKRLLHTTLVSEVMSQLRFPVQNSDLKKRVESLIERDFLERDPDEPTYYRYLA